MYCGGGRGEGPRPPSADGNLSPIFGRSGASPAPSDSDLPFASSAFTSSYNLKQPRKF